MTRQAWHQNVLPSQCHPGSEKVSLASKCLTESVSPRIWQSKPASKCQSYRVSVTKGLTRQAWPQNVKPYRTVSNVTSLAWKYHSHWASVIQRLTEQVWPKNVSLTEPMSPIVWQSKSGLKMSVSLSQCRPVSDRPNLALKCQSHRISVIQFLAQKTWADNVSLIQCLTENAWSENAKGVRPPSRKERIYSHAEWCYKLVHLHYH